MSRLPPQVPAPRHRAPCRRWAAVRCQRANPEATLEIGTETVRVTATPITEGPERDRLYAAMVEVMPGFAEYQEKTDRVIPVVGFTPR
ncbi:nitroreductase family deazaflavin-dependent oxidoreductase [Nocardia amamiensis]|uniref:Nitroreductase family deazaflavin-dependent oxidoreductase n=1 Tax=Nocardia amamiensis TaxID=404578 RepID=A0ABS0CRF2_9NOCA|nr:nitroreductase/quinone reductase family protein [Nocardia amamiensis]MBF6299187.1 nitroreductase family deazaflavin-dependent oxidoreductase [Nocardia amamiensis]